MVIDMLLLFNLLILALLSFAVHLFIHRLSGPRSVHALPPGPKGWPVLGALPLLGRMPHVALADMAKRYGPIMHLKMGSRGVVIASSSEAARAFFRTLDLQFFNRPKVAGATHVAYGAQDLVFADYGPRWKLLRKLCNLHMLGATALNEWVDLRSAEVGHMFRSMYESSRRGEPVVVREMLSCALANMIGQVVLSRRVFESHGSESNEFKDMIVELFVLTGVTNIGDFIPAVAWMDLQGLERKMKRLHKRFDALLTRMVKEHEASMHERKGKPDFLDILMTNPTDDSDGVRLNDSNIKALLLNLFGAATDTTSSTMEWAIAEMLKKPSILERAQDEMDRVIGRNRRFQESDIAKLPYLQAICKEALRMHPSTPLGLPRVCTEACEVDGFHIPEGTRLLVNIWAIGRDPKVWENPMEFEPERFLSEKGAKIDPSGGGELELMPFGAGRRTCVGARMAILVVEYVLGSLVHAFDWKVPDGVELDMNEAFGLALWKEVTVSAMVSPRLAPSVYA